MKCPPYLVSMRITQGERTRFRLWFPLFIMWPLLIALLLLTVVATLLVDLFSLITCHKPGYTRLMFGVLGVIGETRGTEVFIEDGGRRSHQNHNGRTVAFTLR